MYFAFHPSNGICVASHVFVTTVYLGTLGPCFIAQDLEVGIGAVHEREFPPIPQYFS